MIVVKAPLRVSLFGGGTDLPHYCKDKGSTIVSFALDKFIYLTHNDRPTGSYRISYSEVEEIDELGNVQHTLVRAAAERYGLGPACTLTIVGDVPKGTGLGSSSALAVALCKLLFGDSIGRWQLFREAFGLERSINPQVGVQDFLPAVYGGLSVYSIDKDYNVTVGTLPRMAQRTIEKYGMLLYTGEGRNSRKVLPSWTTPKIENPLNKIHAIAKAVVTTPETWIPEVLGSTLGLTWEMKKQAGKVTTAGLDNQYRKAKDAGIFGGKLCGAGQGGCWFFIVPPERRENVKESLGLVEIPFKVNPSPAVEIVV